MTMASKALTAAVFLGSARDGRLGERVSKFMVAQMKKRGWNVHVIDPLELNLPILRSPYMSEAALKTAPAIIASTLEKIRTVDAFVIITCEYNNSLPPGLTNLIDHFSPNEFSHRPSSIVCYSPGMYGGIRAAMQARCFLGEINTITIPNIFGMPRVQKSLDENGKPTDDHMESGAEKHLVQLEWYAKALKHQRELEPKGK